MSGWRRRRQRMRRRRRRRKRKRERTVELQITSGDLSDTLQAVGCRQNDGGRQKRPSADEFSEPSRERHVAGVERRLRHRAECDAFVGMYRISLGEAEELRQRSDGDEKGEDDFARIRALRRQHFVCSRHVTGRREGLWGYDVRQSRLGIEIPSELIPLKFLGTHPPATVGPRPRAGVEIHSFRTCFSIAFQSLFNVPTGIYIGPLDYHYRDTQHQRR